MAELQHGFDIDRQRIGAVYAQSLLDAAEKSGQAEAVVAELESLVADVLDRLPDLDALLSAPRIALDEKQRVLERALASRASELLLTFLKVVCRRRRMDCLREIARAARKLHNERSGVVRVRLSTAAALDPTTRGLLLNVLRGALRTEVQLKHRVEPDLIGGMVVRVGDRVYDGSVAGRLASLREQMIDGAKQQLRSAAARFTESD